MHYPAGSAVPTNLAPEGDSVRSVDQFAARTRFYGPQFGVAGEVRRGPFLLIATAKLGLGYANGEADREGSTISAVNGGSSFVPRGVFVQPSNRGRASNSGFTIVPEVGLAAGWDVASQVRLQIGYNFLYLSRVVRAGDLIDGVDARQVPTLRSFDATAGATHPAPVIDTTSLCIQGLTAGIGLSY